MIGAKSKVGVAPAPKGTKASVSRTSPFNITTTDEAGTDEAFNLKAEVALLKSDIERRQETYIARERAYKQRIDELEDEFNRQKSGKTGWMKTDSKMSQLKQMQHQIVDNVELVQDRTAHILQEQERDLLRAFRARLFDVQTELEKEKGKKDDGAGAWIEKCRQLEAEVEWAKQVADRLERVNQGLVSENTRLRSQASSQEMDRNNLIKELCAYKKDNSILRAEYTALENENESLKDEIRKAQEELNSGLTGGGSGAQGGGRGGGQQNPAGRSDNEERQREANKRLRRLLEEERKALKQVRQNYANELRHRTEMEMLLRTCVEDVRNEISRRKLEDAHFGNKLRSPGRASPSRGDAGGGDNAFMKLYSRSGSAKPTTVENFTKEDRERTLELLLSQERVVTLLYAKTFPIGGRATSSTNPLSPETGNSLPGGAEGQISNSNLVLPQLAASTTFNNQNAHADP